jgi:hypothetical protein
LRYNTSVERNSFCSVNVITSAHDDADASSVASLDRIIHGVSQWVLQSENTNSGQVLLKNQSIFLLCEIIMLRFHVVKLAHRHVVVSNEDGSVSLIREFSNSSLVEPSITVGLPFYFIIFKKMLWNVGLRVNILDASIKR